MTDIYDSLINDSHPLSFLSKKVDKIELFNELNSFLDLRLVYLLYTGKSLDVFTDKELLKLAETLSYLKCSRLDEIIMKINIKKIEITNLDPFLIEKVKDLNRFVSIASGFNHGLALRKNGSITFLG